MIIPVYPSRMVVCRERIHAQLKGVESGEVRLNVIAVRSIASYPGLIRDFSGGLMAVVWWL